MAKKLVESTLQKFERENPEMVKEAFEKHLAEEYTNTAISIVKVKPTLYDVVKIRFNSNGDVGKVEVVFSNVNKSEAQYQFKILTVKEGLFD